MATKNLPRTIIEGGKQGSDKQERREQIQRDRRAFRDFCQTYNNEDDEPIIRAKHYYREYADCLAPLHSFLESRVGKKWDNTWSELCAMTNCRTTRGYHFLNHALGYVKTSRGLGFDETAPGFYIEGGILQYNPYKRTRWRSDKKLLALYENWIGESRQVRLVGTKYFWYKRTERSEKLAAVLNRNDRSDTGNSISFMCWTWRQDIPLNRKEIGHMTWLKVKDDRIWRKILEN